MERDFTIATYQKLLSAFLDAGYVFITFSDWCNGKGRVMQKYVILRHDIDNKPLNAIKIAKLEAELGIRSSYYWLTKKKVFYPDYIKEISRMGHEIGYHYRDWVDAKGSPEKAINLFQKNLSRMRTLTEINTIAMDGCPWSKYNNRDLWKHYDYQSYGITGEPYFDIFGLGDKAAITDVYYLTDTGRMWNGSRYSIRDKVKVNPVQDYHSTFDIMNALSSGNFPLKSMITTHPQRWSDKTSEWITEYIIQKIKNLVKALLVKSVRQ